MTAFPPQNDVYELVDPILLEDADNPGSVLATINTFPAMLNAPSWRFWGYKKQAAI